MDCLLAPCQLAGGQIVQGYMVGKCTSAVPLGAHDGQCCKGVLLRLSRLQQTGQG
jgi:hypothetical protein